MPYSPRVCVVQIVNFCNITCSMCPLPTELRTSMALGDLTRIVQRLRRSFATIEKLEFAGGIGEPTLHPDLPDMIRAAKTAGFRDVGFITNGTTLASRAGALLDAEPSYIIVSQYGSSAGVHAKYQSSDFAAVEAGLEHLLRLAARMQARAPTIRLRYAPRPDDGDDIGAYRTRWMSAPVVVSTRKLHNARGAVDGCEYASAAECASPTDQVVVGPDGYLRSCCINSEGLPRFGSVLEQDPRSLYAGAAFEDWRRRRLSLTCAACSGQKAV